MASCAVRVDDASTADLGANHGADANQDATSGGNANLRADTNLGTDVNHGANNDADVNHIVGANHDVKNDADVNHSFDTNHDTNNDTVTNHGADANKGADINHGAEADDVADAIFYIDAIHNADATHKTDANYDSVVDTNYDSDANLVAALESDVEAREASADHDGVEKDMAAENDEGDHRSELNAAINFYAAKKTVAQGMMDIALITSNANQMRYLLEFGSPNAIYYFNLTLVVISLILQIAVGTALIFKGRADLREERLAHEPAPASTPPPRKEKRLDDAIVVGVFLITIINVFMAAFAIGGNATTPAQPSADEHS